jgi:hypothetical protein
MKLLQKLVFSLIILTCYSCNFNSTNLNREEDKQVGEKIMNTFFDDIKKHDYNATFALYSDKFWEVTSRDKMKQIYEMTTKKLGALTNTSVDKWETRIVKGTNSSAEYLYQYKNTYEKGEALETVRLVEEEGGKIKILAYNINSDNFLK